MSVSDTDGQHDQRAECSSAIILSGEVSLFRIPVHLFRVVSHSLLHLSLLLLSRPVTCIIMQKNGAGLHTASTCFWDTKSDGSCSVRWDNATMHAIVTVFALHI